MTAPGGNTIATAFVQVLPDVRQFAKQLRADLRTSSRELRHLDREIAPVERAFASLGRTVTGIVPGVQLTTRAFIAMGAQSVVGGILAVGGALHAASGAIGVIPATGVAAASAVGTLAVGLRGVKDVLKDFDDAEDFAEGLEELSTNARSALGVLNEMRGGIDNFRDSVQDTLFEGMDDVFRDLGGAFLPRIEGHFNAVASSINGAGKDLAGFLLQADTLADIDTIMSNNELAFRTLRSAVTPAATAIRDIVTVGSGQLPMLTDEVLRLTLKFQNFIAMARITGQLDDWISQGIETIKQLGRIVGNVAGAVNALFSTAETAGLGFLDTLEHLTERMQFFLESAEGQNAVREFLSSAQQSAEALLPVIGEVADVFVEDLFPILADLGTTVSPAVAAFIDSLGESLTIAAPGIQEFAQGFANFITAITPALPTIGTLVGQIGELVGAMATGFGPAIADVAVAIANILIPIIDALTWVFQSVSPEVLKIIVVLGTMVVSIGALTSVVRGVQTVIGLFAGGLDLLAGATTKAQGGVKGFLGFLSGPWGIVIGLATTALGLFLSTTDDTNEKQKEMAAVGKEVNDVIREQAGVIDGVVRAKAAEKLEQEGALDLAKQLDVSTRDLTSAYLDQGDALGELRNRLQGNIRALEEEKSKFDQVRGGAARAEAIQGEIDKNQELLNKINDLVGGREDDIEAQKRQEEASRTGGNAIQFVTAALEAQRLALDFVHEAKLRDQQQALEALNADIAYFNQLERTRVELGEGARILDVHSQEGRDNLAVVAQLIERGNARIAEMKAEGATNAQLNTTIAAQQEELLALLDPFFKSREEARKFAEQLGLIPKGPITPIIGIKDEATPKLNRIQTMINNIIGGDYTVKIKASEAVPGLFQNIAPSNNARGGPVRPGEWSWVGEEGPELVRFGRAARVFTNDESLRMTRDVGALDRMTLPTGDRAGASGGSTSTLAATVNVAPPSVKVYIDGREVRGLVRVELDERDRQLTQLINVGTGRRQ